MIKNYIKKLINKNKEIAKLMYLLKDEYNKKVTFSITPWGFSIYGNEQMAKGDFEVIETKRIRELIKNVDVLINIGANIGYYCLHAASMDKYVIAVEPCRSNVEILMQNVIKNKFEKNIEIHQVALDSDIGISKMWGGGTGASLKEGWSEISRNYFNFVPTNTLDNLMYERFKGKRILIVMDVEGSEYNVLRGAKRMINRDDETLWIAEITTTQNQPEGVFNEKFYDTFEMLFKNGYKAYEISENNLEITRESVIKINREKNKYECYNFLFKK